MGNLAVDRVTCTHVIKALFLSLSVFRTVKDWRKRRREKNYVVELPGAAAALAEEKM